MSLTFHRFVRLLAPLLVSIFGLVACSGAGGDSLFPGTADAEADSGPDGSSPLDATTDATLDGNPEPVLDATPGADAVADSPADSPTPDGDVACVPSCAGKACGQSDGCTSICMNGSCAAGERCVAGACRCDATSCAGGCCSGGGCEPGTSTSACGTGGLACAVCPNSWSCTQGSCVCVPSCTGKACGASDGCGGTCATGSCGSGLHCVGGTCACDPSSCTGCCAGGQCQGGTSDGACGTGGATCSVCASSQSCVYGGCLNAVLLQQTSGGFSSGGHALVLDPSGQNVYFIDQNNSTTNQRIWRVPTSGGGGQVVASAVNWPVTLAVDSVNLYWTSISDNTVVAQSLATGTRRVLATGQFYPMDIAVKDSQTVYWSACTDNGGTQCFVWSLPVSGGTPSNLDTLSGGGNPSLALLLPNLYVTSAGLREVISLAVASGGVSQVVDGTSLLFDGVAAGSGRIAWFAGETASGASNGVVKGAQVGGSPLPVASGQNPYAVAVDASYAYWANGNDANPTLGAILKAPIGGGGVTVLVDHALTYDIAVDSSYVYWLGSDTVTSGLFKTPK